MAVAVVDSAAVAAAVVVAAAAAAAAAAAVAASFHSSLCFLHVSALLHASTASFAVPHLSGPIPLDIGMHFPSGNTCIHAPSAMCSCASANPLW